MRLERGAEPVDVVVGEDIATEGQEPLHHRVLLRHELDDGMRRHPGEERGDHRQRDVGTDRQVMDQRQRHDDVGIDALEQARALGVRPAQWQGWTVMSPSNGVMSDRPSALIARYRASTAAGSMSRATTP